MNHLFAQSIILLALGNLHAQDLPREVIDLVSKFGGRFQNNGECVNLYCAMPLRYFPVIDEGNGDYYGLYFPRGMASPWVVFFGHEETRHWVITTKSDKFLADNKKYIDDETPIPDDEGFPYPITLNGIVGSKYSIVDIASIPVSFLSDALDFGLYDPKTSSYVKFGTDVRAWFYDSMANNLQFKQAVIKPEAIMEWRPWIQLAKLYEKDGKISHAMNCVDMAVQLSHRYPNYGEPNRSKPSWGRLVTILDESKSIVMRSDSIDKYCFDIIHKSAISFTKE